MVVEREREIEQFDTGLSAATAYSYTVRARDAAGNLSAASTAVTATTQPGGGGGGGCTAT
jgi:cellulose 1,4-beta-cellobiosidase